MKTNLIVSKFGGTSMASKMTMMKSAEICKAKDPRIVVVSATSGTTDLLIGILRQAQVIHEIDTLTLTNQFKLKHEAITREVILDRESKELINALYFDLENLFQFVQRTRNFSDETFD